MSSRKTYLVKWLDMRYLQDFDHLNFHYLTYEITADDEKEAVETARNRYMSGQEGIVSEELPFLLKLFSVITKSDH